MNLSSSSMFDSNDDGVAVVRTFRAPDARSALTAVKAAFGADAVILDTRQIGGGLFSRPQIEVTAAPPVTAPAPELRPARFDDHVVTERRPVGRAAYGAAARRSERGNSDQAAGLGQLARRAVTDRDRDRDRDFGIDDNFAAGRARSPELSAAARRVFKHLLDRGMDAEQARELVEDAEANGADGVRDLFLAIRSKIAGNLRSAAAPWTREGRRTIALIGPTGVGKTTAIAKIAARALLETGFKVGLITVDTYRVGASDQLARYGRIMGVPTHVAKTKAELATALDRCRDADLILIDTAGRSDAESRAAQMDLVRSAPRAELHLVMSLATGARELAAVARRYSAFSPERLIFTKLDEAEAPAGALAASAIIPRPVSCLCDGQRVPEDIHAVTDDVLAEKLIGIPARMDGSARSNLGFAQEEVGYGSGR